MKNKGMKIFLSLIGGILFIVLLISIIFYNNLVQAEENVNDKWNEVNEQYQNRTNLIPDFVNTAKSYYEFRDDVLTEISEAVSNINQFNVNPEIINNEQEFSTYQHLQTELSRSLLLLLSSMENYPALKANERVQQFKARLERNENKISVARKDFNNEAKEFNIYIKLFPTTIFSEIFQFNEKQYFTSTRTEEILLK